MTFAIHFDEEIFFSKCHRFRIHLRQSAVKAHRPAKQAWLICKLRILFLILVVCYLIPRYP